MTVNMSKASSQQRSLEIVPLADRLRWMLVVRFGVAVGPIAAWFAEPAWRATSANLLLLPALLLLAGALVIHPLSVRNPSVARRSITLLAVLDALYLDWALYLTGGTSGPVVYLIALQLLAVTLLVSFRTGMSLAFCHSLVVMINLEAVSTGLLPRLPGVGGFNENRFSVFLVAIWLTALTTASLAAVNERELRRRRYDEEILRRFGMALQGADTAAKVAAPLLDFTADGADASLAALYCRIAAHDGMAEAELTARLRAGGEMEVVTAADAPTPGSLLQTASSRSRTMLAALRERDRWVDGLLDGAARVVVVPFAEGRVTGMLAFTHDGRAGSRIEQRRLGIVEQAVAHAATAFAYAALLEHLQASAMTDGLTGVANRRAFDAALDRELSIAARGDSSVAVILIDLDHFKSLNDCFGHLTGDDVLRGVGAALRSCLRQGDVVARYGGEEFALILPSGTATDAAAAARRVREALAGVTGPRPVTASLGIACGPDHGANAAELLAAADTALYAAKLGGRNQAHIAGGDGPVEGSGVDDANQGGVNAVVSPRAAVRQQK